MVRYLAGCFGHSAFKLVFCIAYDFILICLAGDCFIYKLKLRDPLRRHEIAPTLLSSDARPSGCAMGIEFERGFI